MPRLDPPIETQNVLAERSYIVVGSRPRRTIAIKIAFPVKDESGRFVCQSEISDGTTRIVRPMNGVDSFEALFLAISNIGIELTLFSDISKDRFNWHGGQKSGLQFPTMPDCTLRDDPRLAALTDPQHLTWIDSRQSGPALGNMR